MPSKGDTFISLFDKARKSHADQECYISYDGNMDRRSIAFKDLWTLASRFAFNLRQHGLERGDYVANAIPSSIEYIVANFGVIFAGGILVPMEKFFPKCEMIKEAIKMTKSKFLLLTDSAENDTWPIFEPNAIKDGSQGDDVIGYKDATLPSLKKIIFVNKTEGGKQCPGTFLNLLRSCKNEFRDVDLDPEDGCIATASLNPGLATPKLIELSHRAIVNASRLWRRLSAGNGKIHTKYPWYIGACVPFDALMGVPRVITDNNNKMATGVGEHYHDVAKSEGLKAVIMSPPDARDVADFINNDGGKKLLENIYVGGQPMTRAVFETSQKVATNVNILYMTSEAQFVSMNSLTPDDTFTPLDSGFPCNGVEVRIMDEDYQELPRGKTGRIAIRSPYLFTRYPGQPELTKSVWRDDGWFYPGDAGCLGKDGHLHVFGRQGDVISRGIILTYPPWIEQPLMNIPDVMQVMAVPVPDDINYKNICACVVLRPGSKLTDQDIHRLYVDSVSGEGVDTFPLDYVLIFEGALPRLSRDKLGDVATQKLGLKSMNT